MATVIGSRIAERRKAKHLTQRKLAELTGQVQSAISHWETGARLIEMENVMALAVVLETTADYLLGLTNDPLPLSDRERGFVDWLRGLPGEPTGKDFDLFVASQHAAEQPPPRRKR